MKTIWLKSPIAELWWKFWPGKIIDLPMPDGFMSEIVWGVVTVGTNMSEQYYNMLVWMEEHVGVKGRDWNWQIHTTTELLHYKSETRLAIKLRRGKEKQASIIALKFS